MKNRLNVCGDISAKRYKLYILSYKLAFLGGPGLNISLNFWGGILAVTNWHYFADLQ